MKKILVVNVNWIGDVIFSYPIFKVLKKKYPQAEVVCLAVPRVKEVVEANSYVDRCLIYDEDTQHRNVFGKIKLILQLRQEKFNIVFLSHRSFTRAFLVFLAGIPQRIGYSTKKRSLLLTHRVTPLSGKIHRSDHYLNVLESFGINVDNRICDLVVSNQAQDDMSRKLQNYGITEEDPLVVVNTGGNWDLKRWPKENFATLITRLIDELNVKVVIPGAKKDVELAKDIEGLSQRNPTVLAGQTNFKELTALLERANLVISADTGPLHLANAVGSYVIGLFGPTCPEVTGPRGIGRFFVIQKNVNCNKEPCYYLDCPDNICMKSITVDDVMDVVKSILT